MGGITLNRFVDEKFVTLVVYDIILWVVWAFSIQQPKLKEVELCITVNIFFLHFYSYKCIVTDWTISYKDRSKNLLFGVPTTPPQFQMSRPLWSPSCRIHVNTLSFSPFQFLSNYNVTFTVLALSTNRVQNWT